MNDYVKFFTLVTLILGLFASLCTLAYASVPDHDIGVDQVTTTYNDVFVGDPIYIDAYLFNSGEAGVDETFDVTCSYYGTGVTETTIETRQGLTLTRDSTWTITFEWNTNGVAPGEYTIKVRVTLTSEGVTDQFSGNDESTTTVTINEPVYDVEAYDQSVSVTEVVPGESVSISVIVLNRGSFSESFAVACYYDDVNLIETQQVEGLPSGQTQTLTFVWDTTGVSQGEHSIKVVADPANLIDESDEFNNECTTPANLFVVPEYQLGALMAIVASLLATVGYRTAIKRKSKQ